MVPRNTKICDILALDGRSHAEAGRGQVQDGPVETESRKSQLQRREGRGKGSLLGK